MRLRILQLKPQEEEKKTKLLRAAGHDLDMQPFSGTATLKEMASNPPDVIVIDLDHVPSQGRDIAVALKHRAATRGIPIVMAGGVPGKVSKIMILLPHLTYCEWTRIRGAIRSAQKQDQSQDPPESVFAAYAGRSLSAKLGIKPKDRVALLSAPASFKTTLGNLPPGVKLAGQARGPFSVVIQFLSSRNGLERRFPVAAGACEEKGRLWIAWPKKSSGKAKDLDQRVVRAFGLAEGWVDFKIASFDSTWTGLCFVRRK
ncbi:hypothetical protein H8E52_10245 [bacterium]|nr:hypothetical protein [bacterium]